MGINCYEGETETQAHTISIDSTSSTKKEEGKDTQ